MHLTEINILDLIKRQYIYKLKANFSLLATLVMVQLIGLAFSFMGMAGMSFHHGSQTFSVSVRSITGSGIIFFTLIWALAISIGLASKRDLDFAFVSNRLSSNLSTIGFLATASIIGGVTAGLSGPLLRNISYFLQGYGDLIGEGFNVPLSYTVISILATTLLGLLITSIGYLAGTMFAISGVFKIVVPAIFIGLVIGEANGANGILVRTFRFFLEEPNLSFFTVKTLAVAFLLYTLATAISNNIEVRR